MLELVVAAGALVGCNVSRGAHDEQTASRAPRKIVGMRCFIGVTEMIFYEKTEGGGLPVRPVDGIGAQHRIYDCSSDGIKPTTKALIPD